MEKIKFYTLLYIDSENQSLSHNGLVDNFHKQIETFVKCCVTLNKSLLFFANSEMTVITNNKPYIKNISTDLKCLEIDFNFKIPKDIGFFSAHHKIDVFKYLSQLDPSQYSVLIDCDILCVNKIPQNLVNCINKNIPVYYDITDQVYPRYGRNIITRDKEVLMSGEASNGLWAGGEFMGGDNIFFGLLSDQIDLIKKDYLDNYKSLHHQGDEILVSVAIEKIMNQMYICNAGSFGGIRRYWSDQIWRSQYNLNCYKDDFLLHLPADKKFIAELSIVDTSLMVSYKKYLWRISLWIVMKKIIKSTLKYKKH